MQEAKINSKKSLFLKEIFELSWKMILIRLLLL